MRGAAKPVGNSSTPACDLGLCSATNAPYMCLWEVVCRCRRWVTQHSRACRDTVPWSWFSMPKQSFGALSWYGLAQTPLCLQILRKQLVCQCKEQIVLVLKASQGSERVLVCKTAAVLCWEQCCGSSRRTEVSATAQSCS